MTRLLVLDTETGGLNPETDALLSVGLVDWEDGTILRQEEILVDAEGLTCDPKALAVNHIDLDVHHAYSVSRKEAAQRFNDFCVPLGRGAYIVGHNLPFDVGFVDRLIHQPWERKAFGSLGRWSLDTMQVLAFLGHAGLIPEGIRKLDQAVAHFGIEVPAGQRHTALADAVATAHLYTALLGVLR